MNETVELINERAVLQETMTFLGAIASGLEEAIGESANGITYVAGRNLGMRFSESAPKTDDIGEALAAVEKVLKDNQCLWMFEIFKTHDRKEAIEQTGKGEEVMLVFRDCMIRQSLFKYGHHQKGSLCNMMYGFFSGALQNIMGRDSSLEIVHAGENSCYKRLTVYPKGAEKGAPVERTN